MISTKIVFTTFLTCVLDANCSNDLSSILSLPRYIASSLHIRHDYWHFLSAIALALFAMLLLDIRVNSWARKSGIQILFEQHLGLACGEHAEVDQTRCRCRRARYISYTKMFQLEAARCMGYHGVPLQQLMAVIKHEPSTAKLGCLSSFFACEGVSPSELMFGALQACRLLVGHGFGQGFGPGFGPGFF